MGSLPGIGRSRDLGQARVSKHPFLARLALGGAVVGYDSYSTASKAVQYFSRIAHRAEKGIAQVKFVDQLGDAFQSTIAPLYCF